MKTLEQNTSFYQMKKYAADAEKSFSDFASSLNDFGREPGERWHAAADEFNKTLAGLRGILAELGGKNSLPSAKRKEFISAISSIAGKLSGMRKSLRREILAACPPLPDILPATAAAAAAWEKYEKESADIPDPLVKRESFQRLIQRAHNPASAFKLAILPDDDYPEMLISFGLFFPAQELLRHTPLPSLGGLTLEEGMRKNFIKAVASENVPPSVFFNKFVGDVSSDDKERRKNARKELRLIRDSSNDESHGRVPRGDFSKSREMWGVWTGVKNSLLNPDPAYRRAALCALPYIHFSFIASYFPEECADFIFSALRDTDGMVRYKTLRFAVDFLRLARLDHPETVKLVEKRAGKLVSETKGKNPQVATTARKLLREIAWFRDLDKALELPRSGEAAPGNPPEEEYEISFSIPRKRPFETVFQFKITLLGTEPPVWRRIQVPGSYTFYDLHVAVQNAMGWEDRHLHAFEIPEPGTKPPARIESPYAVEDLHEEPSDFTTEAALGKYLKKEGDLAVYTYDFGDGWRHEVLLEDIVPKKAGMKYPLCLDGERACPPEDCGGPGGYAGCAQAAAIKTVSDEDDEALALLTWLDGWTPEKFDHKEVVFENPRKRFLETMEND